MIAKAIIWIKTLLIVVLSGAALIASFYFAYVLIIVGVLCLVGTIAYLIFKYQDSDDVDEDWFDFTN